MPLILLSLLGVVKGRLTSKITSRHLSVANYLFLLLLSVAFITPFNTVWGQNRSTPLEYRVKAAFILNFAKYITVEGQPAPQAPTEFRICLWKKDVFQAAGRELERAVLASLPVRVKTIVSNEEIPNCRVLFITENYSEDLNQLESVAASARVLTVTESSGAGVLNFQVIDGQVRFDCNLFAASRAGIKLSSQLVKLAISVEGESS